MALLSICLWDLFYENIVYPFYLIIFQNNLKQYAGLHAPADLHRHSSSPGLADFQIYYFIKDSHSTSNSRRCSLSVEQSLSGKSINYLWNLYMMQLDTRLFRLKSNSCKTCFGWINHSWEKITFLLLVIHKLLSQPTLFGLAIPIFTINMKIMSTKNSILTASAQIL